MLGTHNGLVFGLQGNGGHKEWQGNSGAGGLQVVENSGTGPSGSQLWLWRSTARTAAACHGCYTGNAALPDGSGRGVNECNAYTQESCKLHGLPTRPNGGGETYGVLIHVPMVFENSSTYHRTQYICCVAGLIVRLRAYPNSVLPKIIAAAYLLRIKRPQKPRTAGVTKPGRGGPQSHCCTQHAGMQPLGALQPLLICPLGAPLKKDHKKQCTALVYEPCCTTVAMLSERPGCSKRQLRDMFATVGAASTQLGRGGLHDPNA